MADRRRSTTTFFRSLFFAAAFVVLALGFSGCTQNTDTAEQPVRPGWVLDEIESPKIDRQVFFSNAAGTKTSYFVFVPRPYHRLKNKRFPVIYWLHGHGSGRVGVPPLSNFFAKAMRNKDMPLALVVFPNGLVNSMWVDSKDGSVPMETLLMTELIPHVDSTYRTVANRNGRIIEGWSMGGYGAPRLAMLYPHVFSAASILAGGPLQPDFHVRPARGGVKPSERNKTYEKVFGNDDHYFHQLSPWVIAQRFAYSDHEPLAIRQICGTRDHLFEFNVDFHRHLISLRIEHEFTPVPGHKHDTIPTLSAVGDAFWAFYRNNLP